MRPSFFIALLLAALFAIVLGCRPNGGGVQNIAKKPSDVVQGEAPVKGVLATTLSCSGRGCHADINRAEDAKRYPSSCSYSLWSDNDPHARAYQVLHGELGQRMGKLLGIDDVTKHQRCLACHVIPEAASAAFLASTPRPEDEWTFGVGCESCHGPATKWLKSHYEEKWTTKASDAKVIASKKEKGYRDLSDLVERGRVCAGCHIGAPADAAKGIPLRDMNHDFIAVGHPRLMFEYGAFLANLPRHWKQRDAEMDDARVWAVGQFVSAEAAMKLLADRASVAAKQDPTRPWPEFSEYDCYACHQTLVPESWRKGKGQLRPSRWYTGLLGDLGATVGPNLDKLDGLMRKRYPDPDAVAAEADAIRKALPVTATPTRAAYAKYLAALKARGQKLDALGWDEVEQIGLGMLALSRGTKDEATEKKTRELLGLIGFPKGQDSSPNFRRKGSGKAGEKVPSEEELKKLFGELK